MMAKGAILNLLPPERREELTNFEVSSKTTSTVNPRLSFSIMIALLRAAMAARLVTEIV